MTASSEVKAQAGWLCLSQDQLLLLDEPTAGMARADTNNTIDLLKNSGKAEYPKVVIEHDMHGVLLAEKISVLAQVMSL